jgi:hypothetical protein
MATAADLIKGSLRLIGALAAGETPSAPELQDGLASANSMLESWLADGLIVFETTREEFTLLAGTATRTMGVGGNFNTSRPVKVTNVSVEISYAEYELDILTPQEWAVIPNKSLQGLPTKVFLSGTSPLQTLNFWPVPSSAYTVNVQSEKPIATMVAETVLQFPPGYERALRYNLAIELAPEFGKTVSAEVAEIARTAKGTIMRANIKDDTMESDVLGMGSCRGGYDINSGPGGY